MTITGTDVSFWNAFFFGIGKPPLVEVPREKVIEMGDTYRYPVQLGRLNSFEDGVKLFGDIVDAEQARIHCEPFPPPRIYGNASVVFEDLDFPGEGSVEMAILTPHDLGFRIGHPKQRVSWRSVLNKARQDNLCIVSPPRAMHFLSQYGNVLRERLGKKTLLVAMKPVTGWGYRFGIECQFLLGMGFDPSIGCQDIYPDMEVLEFKLEKPIVVEVDTPILFALR